MKNYNVRTVTKTFGLMVFVGFLCGIVLMSCGMSKSDLDPEMQNILAYTYGDSREPLTVVADIVRESSGNTAERLSIEKQFAWMLGSDEATLDCKDFICRQLWVIGTKESVPVLEKMLVDATTSDMACYALASNPTPEAGNALRNALGTAQGKALIGVINLLGDRQDTECVGALEELKTNADRDVAAAAEAALVKIRG